MQALPRLFAYLLFCFEQGRIVKLLSLVPNNDVFDVSTGLRTCMETPLVRLSLVSDTNVVLWNTGEAIKIFHYSLKLLAPSYWLSHRVECFSPGTTTP